MALYCEKLFWFQDVVNSFSKSSFSDLNSTVQANNDIKVKVKLKFTLVQALRLCTGRTAHKGE